MILVYRLSMNQWVFSVFGLCRVEICLFRRQTRVSKIYLETRRGGIFLDGQTSFPGTSLPLKTCFNLLHEAATSSTERLQTLKTAVLVHFFWGVKRANLQHYR